MSRLFWCVTIVLAVLLSAAVCDLVELYVPEWAIGIICLATMGLVGGCGGWLIAKYEFGQLKRLDERHMEELRKRYGYTLRSEQDKGQGGDKKC